MGNPQSCEGQKKQELKSKLEDFRKQLILTDLYCPYEANRKLVKLVDILIEG